MMRIYSGLIYSIVYNKNATVCTKEDFEECVSDVFVSFYNERSKIDLSKGSIKAFISVIAKRKAITTYRKFTSVKAKTTLTFIENYTETFCENHPDCAEIVEREELHTQLISAVKALKEPDSNIIFRRFYYGEKTREIAEHFGMSDDAIKKRIRRSLDKLKKHLEKCEI